MLRTLYDVLYAHHTPILDNRYYDSDTFRSM